MTHIAPHLGAVAGYAMSGYTDKEIAKAFGVSYSTFRGYVKAYEELKELLRTNKDIADKEIINQAYKLAMGFYMTVKKPYKLRKREYSEKTGKCIRDEEVIEVREEEIYIPPNAQVMQFWLANRQKEDWKPQSKLETDTGGIERIETRLDADGESYAE